VLVIIHLLVCLHRNFLQIKIVRISLIDYYNAKRIVDEYVRLAVVGLYRNVALRT